MLGVDGGEGEVVRRVTLAGLVEEAGWLLGLHVERVSLDDRHTNGRQGGKRGTTVGTVGRGGVEGERLLLQEEEGANIHLHTIPLDGEWMTWVLGDEVRGGAGVGWKQAVRISKRGGCGYGWVPF